MTIIYNLLDFIKTGYLQVIRAYYYQNTVQQTNILKLFPSMGSIIIISQKDIILTSSIDYPCAPTIVRNGKNHLYISNFLFQVHWYRMISNGNKYFYSLVQLQHLTVQLSRSKHSNLRLVAELFSGGRVIMKFVLQRMT